MFDLKRFAALEQRMDQQLRNFSDDGAPAPEKDQEKKWKNGHPLAGPGMAAAAVTGGIALGSRRKEIKAGVSDRLGKAKSAVQAGQASAKEAGRTAIFRGMRKSAEVLKGGSKVAGRVAANAPNLPVSKGAAAISQKLAKGAKKLRKGSMGFFSRADADRVLDLASRISALELEDDSNVIPFSR